MAAEEDEFIPLDGAAPPDPPRPLPDLSVHRSTPWVRATGYADTLTVMCVAAPAARVRGGTG
jgi:hypothetical protein